MSAWYDDRRHLAAVARYMGERGDTVDDVAYMLERPEKYGDDWQGVQIDVEAEILLRQVSGEDA